MRRLHPFEVTAHDQAARHALPEAVAAALGELVGAAQEGLLALSIGVGLGVLESLMEEKRTALVGPRSKPNAERTAVRHGHESGEVTLGGRRVAVRRPRALKRRRFHGDSAHDLRALRRPRSADASGARAHAGQRLDAPLPAHPGAGRRTGRAGGALDVEVGGLAGLRGAHPRGARRADDPPPRRRAARGLDARRHRAQGAHKRRLSRDHDRGRQDLARALGGIERERHGRDVYEAFRY